MLYLIGLGLNERGLTQEGAEALQKCQKIYLEGYTVDFPYDIRDIERSINKKIIKLNREDVESNKLIEEAKDDDIALLVYGSPFFATTHISLVQDCIKNQVKYKIIYSASIFDALGETGLQLYKFGKTASLPAWTESHKPTSFTEIIKQNQSINAHTLLLIDIGLSLNQALDQLINSNIDIDKIIICSRLGCKDSKILYDTINNLKNKEIAPPFCIIIPAELHFSEKEVLDKL